MFRGFLQRLRSKCPGHGGSEQTPLPKGIVIALFFSMFGNAIAMQVLFAFLPDMVKSFGISDENTGYYVGLLASSVFLGRFISSYFWGWISDKIGRRKVLLFCSSLTGFAMIAFGFSKSFKMALLIRFITGVVAGAPGTVKASLAEICDDTNQALGMSVVVTAWNSGLIIGPAIGGYLAKPASKYSAFSDRGNKTTFCWSDNKMLLYPPTGILALSDFFREFAYLMPCLIAAFINFLSFFLVFFILPETLASKRKFSDDKETSNELNVNPKKEKELVSTRKRVSDSSLNIPRNGLLPKQAINDQKYLKSPSEETLFLSGSMSFLPELPEIYLQRYPGSLAGLENDGNKPYELKATESKQRIMRKSLNSIRKSKLAQLLRNKDVRSVVSLYTVFSFGVVSEHEAYSLWAATQRKHGGLDFDTNDLGFTLTCCGAICALSNFIVFPWLVKMVGLVKAQVICLMAGSFFTVILPTSSIFYGRDITLNAVVIIYITLIRVTQGACFTGQFIMTGNSVTSALRATVHGFAMTAVCAARAISPSVFGSLFSWSITSGLGFPFNEKFVFILLGFINYLSIIIACCLDEAAVSQHSED